MRRAMIWLVGAAAVGTAACGQSSGGMGACNPASSASFTIAAAGINPMAVCVLPGGSVTFVNGDTVAHDVESTGNPCPVLNLGAIPAGQNKVAVFPTVETCTFHDASNPSNAAFQGTVAVSNSTTTGPVY